MRTHSSVSVVLPFLLTLPLLACPAPRGGGGGGGGGSDPEISLTAPTAEGRYYSDAPVPLLALVSDEEDDPDELTVTFRIDGEEVGEAVSVDAEGLATGAAELDAGEYTLEAEVSDSDDNDATVEVTFTVGGPNTPPTCSITFPSPSDFLPAGATARLEGQAADVDVDSSLLTASFASSRGGELGEVSVGSNGSFSLDVDDLDSGSHTLTLTVRDDAGAECEDTVTVDAVPAPEVVISRPTPGATVHEGTPFSLQAGVSVDMGPISATVRSDVSGVLDTDASNGTFANFEWQLDGLAPGEHTLTVEAEDGRGLVGEGTVDIVVNGAPSVPGVTINPSTPLATDTLVASVTSPSTDPEGGSVTYQYSWFRNSQPAGNSGQNVPSSSTTRGEIWTVEVVATDGNARSAPGTDSVTIQNNAPTITTPSVSPGTLYTEDTAICSAGSTYDADGDPVTVNYSWEVSGSPAGSNSSTLDGAYFDKGESVVCITTPHDGFTPGPAMSSTPKTVVNTPPEEPTISISPSNPESFETLSCDIDVPSYDADGDTVTYEYTWYQDSFLTGYTSSTVPSSATTDDEVWECEALPWDGEGYGPAAVAAVTIGAQPQLLNVGTHSTTYSSSSTTRGFWFQAPISFTITGLRVPTNLSGGQNVQVMRFNSGAPPNWSSTTTNHTTLFYTTGVAGSGWIGVNIAVAAGDYIGILGARGTTTMNNSYRASGNFSSSFDGVTTTLTRLIYQSNLYSSQAGTVASENNGNMGRIEVEYVP